MLQLVRPKPCDDRPCPFCTPSLRRRILRNVVMRLTAMQTLPEPAKLPCTLASGNAADTRFELAQLILARLPRRQALATKINDPLTGDIASATALAQTAKAKLRPRLRQEPVNIRRSIRPGDNRLNRPKEVPALKIVVSNA